MLLSGLVSSKRVQPFFVLLFLHRKVTNKHQRRRERERERESERERERAHLASRLAQTDRHWTSRTRSQIFRLLCVAYRYVNNASTGQWISFTHVLPLPLSLSHKSNSSKIEK